MEPEEKAGKAQVKEKEVSKEEPLVKEKGKDQVEGKEKEKARERRALLMDDRSVSPTTLQRDAQRLALMIVCMCAGAGAVSDHIQSWIVRLERPEPDGVRRQRLIFWRTSKMCLGPSLQQPVALSLIQMRNLLQRPTVPPLSYHMCLFFIFLQANIARATLATNYKT